MRYVTIDKFTELSGLSRRAITNYIGSGIWVEEREYRKAPDGKTLIDVEGCQRWVEGRAIALEQSDAHSAPTVAPYAFTPDTLAERWGVSGATIRSLIRSKQLRFIRIGRQYRIRPEHVEEYERQSQVQLVR
jgi:excisionase family DNA binding protein